MVEGVMVSQVDFHVHYTEETAKEIIDEAKEKRMAAIALISRVAPTGNVNDYVDYGEKCGVTVIPGVEVLATFGDRSVELIALGFDLESEAALDMWSTESNKKSNIKIASRQKQMFEKDGFNFDLNGLGQDAQNLLEDVLGGEINAKAIKFCEILVKSHNFVNQNKISALIATEKELWEEVCEQYQDKEFYKDKPERLKAKFLYQHYFGPDKKGRFLGQKDVDFIIEKIHAAGGVVLYSPEGDFAKSDWDKLNEMGCDGVMAWHGGSLGTESGSVDVPMDVIKEVRNQGKLVLGGSDYDPRKKDWKMGIGHGGLYMSKRRLYDYKEYLARSREN